MATFIIHAKFSQDAIKGLLAKPEDRFNAVAALCDSVGAKLLHYYVTTGEYDVLLIAEADDGARMVEGAMIAAAAGVVSSINTCRAWTTAEFKEMAERAGAAMAKFRSPG